jgi:hypothetical protein
MIGSGENSSIEANKDKESLVILLKKRLDLINQVSGKQSEQVLAFNLINNLTNLDINLTSLSKIIDLL